MNRKNIAKGKMVRRFGVNIFEQPKYDKLLKRKPNPPGMHGRSRKGKVTEYGKQLVEKQKVKFTYGVSERQLTNIFREAKRHHGVTGHNLLALLERRIDNVVYRAGFAISRAHARQIVSHGVIILNGRRVTVPSITLRANDELRVKDKDSLRKLVRSNIERTSTLRNLPTWIEVNADALQVKVTRPPARDEIPTLANEQMIVEYYSKRA
ncbi:MULTISPECIES: 30S ribosomal protein S4 [unclassified Borrelia]|uniref:30S ribosomal protein S4 n=1 Tax=unclassified Borrelia TaxID=2649934 RepID=UPI001E57AF44|nr:MULTISPECIES: 30S ribosomal protein S4 [unclassified Borrelia]UGQ16280.1 30S ribosomal protein S4 [Borrelia sp. RT5S]UGQ17399.1 30S ribosomal protein S4 [Borrelia sp. RT1S]